MPIASVSDAPGSSIKTDKIITLGITGEGAAFRIRAMHPNGTDETIWTGSVYAPYYLFRSTIQDLGGGSYTMQIGRSGPWEVAPTFILEEGDLAVGPQGEPGPQGPQGPEGPRGPDGLKGDTGTAPYPIPGNGILAVPSESEEGGYDISLDQTFVASEANGNGLMTSVQQTLVDNATDAATPGYVAKRAASTAACSFGPLTAPSVASATANASFYNSTSDGMNVSSTVCAVHHSAACTIVAGTSLGITTATTFSVTATGAASITSSAAVTLTGQVLSLRSTVGGIDVNSKTGIVNVQKDSTTAVVWTVDPTGQVKIAPVAGVTSWLLQQAQHASAAGKPATLRAQRGFAGFVGGDLTIGGGEGGTSGTNLAGKTIIDLGALVSGNSAICELWVSGASVFTMRRTVSSAFELTGTLLTWIKGASGAIISSNDESVKLHLNQGDGINTIYGLALENTGQYSSAINKITTAATMNINWNLSNTVWLGATAATKVTVNMTVAAPTNPREGNITYRVRAVSNGTNTLTWNAAFVFPATGNGINQWAAGVPADGKVTIHDFAWNGTEYECVSSTIR